MPAGWIIVLAAVVMLPPGASRIVFTLAGVGVQTLGLAVVIRAFAMKSGGET